ncbi:hypothetical protein, variant 2 [Aphanomyces astaci]|uniref:Fibronectin type-III domain-containing protein n=1 Tax=Aphanomyces astaci TaxID=112090 RepID=W4FKE5_APHAT|nr:hypothetical protein, variant 2 [Aphanomyces astaci]ETV67967.1 hypothetical protein, variant 2 [Aphanomyces astaci]|eukprot:XP_009842532.1 hypothetical protein, variant 2 [Aphanomyces astaci]
MDAARIRVGSRRQTSRGGKRLSSLLAQNGKIFKRSVLTPEMVMEEEKMAARMIQRMVRARVARNCFRRVLTEVYTKIYDKTTKQVRYVDNRTGVATETKPLLLLLMKCEGQEQIEPLRPDDAAIRIQHCVRSWRARLLLREMVRDLYQKHMDPKTMEYYYLNTQTKQVFYSKPVFLGDTDIELERFKYRHAACRLSTKANLIGNGVLVLFNRVHCILTDNFTLPDEETARFSRVQFNHCQGSIPFMIRLRSDLFFMTSTYTSYQLVADPTLDFSLCAIDADEFHIAAGDSVEPIKIAFNNRRMCCADDVLRHEEIEMVGHPHGKMAVVGRGHVDKFIPNMVKPKRLQYRNPMESGASGSPVFNFGGRLLGIHHHRSLREPAFDCTFLKPIVDFTREQITPPVPLLQSACLTHDMVNVYWQVPPQYKPWNGLKLEFVLEMCNRTRRGTQGYYDRFETIYTGPKATYTVHNLKPATKYAFRCRSAHFMDKSGWGAVMQVTTLPADAIAYMVKSNDALVHRQSILWVKERINNTRLSTPEDEVDPAILEWTNMEPQYIACNASAAIRESVDKFHHVDDHVLDCLDVLGQCCQYKTEFRDRMVTIPTFEWIAHLFPHFSSVAAVLEKAVGLLGHLVKDNEAGKEIFMTIQGIPMVLEVIEANIHAEGVVREACYLLAALCQNFRPAQQHMGVNLGIKVMSKVLTTFPYHPQVLYWACLTLGNVACDYEPNQARGQKYHIVECLVQSKITFILKLNALEDAIDKETKLMETMAATAIGEEVRNEMDLHEHRRRSLMDIYNFMQSENVLGVANYALEYMMNATQKDVQARTKQMATRIVVIRLGAAMAHWRRQADKVLQGHILRRFINGVMEQTLYAAFRTWEMSMRELRVEQSTLAYRTKQGLILDLRKSKRQDRYRLLVNSK